MKARLVRTKASGQSLPLIALMIVVLIAMVGLAVDVGNTYAEQRSTVRASNSAAITGMSQVIGNSQDSNVYQSVVKSLEANGLQIAPRGQEPAAGQRLLTATYLDAQGKSLGKVGDFGNTAPPNGIKYLQVNVGGKVDTYFARVVGQNTLPVGADAFAARGTCSTGVYPFAVREKLLDANGFLPPFTPYSDQDYRYKTQRRIYLNDNSNLNGGFSFLRWRSGPQYGSGNELVAMFTGAGDLEQGFDEAPWPATGVTGLIKPPNYPVEKNSLTPPEWVYGNSGVSWSADLRAALDWHIARRTVMKLPIFDVTNGSSGINGDYHVSRLGSFLLRGYGNEAGVGGSNKYLDLVYIGPAADCPYLIGNPPKPPSLTVAGNIWYKPRSATTPQSRPPVQIEIILDLSGSMGWNFAGQAGNSGNPTQCTGVPYTPPCDKPWNNKNERRIVVAKNAIKGFIDNMDTTNPMRSDIMRIVTFHNRLTDADGYSNSKAVSTLTEALPAIVGTSNGWSSDKNELKGILDSFENKPQGLTPSAVGIARATQEMAQAPTKAPNGEAYGRIAVFLTDGVANVMRDGSQPTYGGNCVTYSSEIASCNIGTTNSNPPLPLPINAMQNEAASLKQLSQVFVIALAGVDEAGLKEVASQTGPPYFQAAKTAADLDGIFAKILPQMKPGACVPLDSQYTNKLAEENMGNNPQQPHNYPTVGYVYLYDQNGNALPSGQDKLPITVDDQSGVLTYNVSGIAPGSYTMKAFVDYIGADGVSRTYNLFTDQNTGSTSQIIPLTIPASSGLSSVVTLEPKYLDLNGDPCPAAP
jgi:hypothetical protein